MTVSLSSHIREIPEKEEHVEGHGADDYLPESKTPTEEVKLVNYLLKYPEIKNNNRITSAKTDLIRTLPVETKKEQDYRTAFKNLVSITLPPARVGRMIRMGGGHGIQEAGSTGQRLLQYKPIDREVAAPQFKSLGSKASMLQNPCCRV